MRFVVVALLAAIMLPMYTHAQLVITKVMANPAGSNAGRQWVQLSNTGTTPVDLGAKNIRFYTTSGNHLIKAYATGGTLFLPGSTGVIAENPMSFLFDYPSFTGQLFKSSFTLPAAGLVGIVQTDGTVLVKKSYVSPVTPTSFGKPEGTSKSTTKRATTRTTSSSKSQLKASNKKSYGSTGTIAPAADANASAAGAVFTMPALLVPIEPYLETMWFSVFLALIAFSGFSLIVIQRHYYV